MAQQGITTTAVRTAAVELEKMKGSLKGWLKYRELNDRVLAGAVRTKVPPTQAKRLVAASRDVGVEQDLAVKLHALLTELMPGVQLPTNAVDLARLAVDPPAPGQAQQPMSGIISSASAHHPWLWPVLIVGGLLLAVTTAVKTAADVAKEKEHYACIQAGACTDYGFWLKAGGITVLAWFAWTQLGLGDFVKKTLKGRS
jgi:hypothetical protein